MLVYQRVLLFLMLIRYIYPYFGSHSTTKWDVRCFFPSQRTPPGPQINIPGAPPVPCLAVSHKLLRPQPGHLRKAVGDAPIKSAPFGALKGYVGLLNKKPINWSYIHQSPS